MHARTSNVTRPRLSADDPRLGSARPSQSVAAASATNSDVARPPSRNRRPAQARPARGRGGGGVVSERPGGDLVPDTAATTHSPAMRVARDREREEKERRVLVLPSAPLPRPPTCTIRPSPAADGGRRAGTHVRWAWWCAVRGVQYYCSAGAGGSPPLPARRGANGQTARLTKLPRCACGLQLPAGTGFCLCRAV